MKPATRLFESFHGEGHYGVHPMGLRPEYKSYRSPHAPPYKIDPNFHGINLRKATNMYVRRVSASAKGPFPSPQSGPTFQWLTRSSGLTLGMFGGVAGIFAIFFFSDVPRVRIDIMEKLPFIGERFKKVIPPEDNPF